MEAYSAPVGYVFSLNAGGRSGTFDVVAGDFSAELAADTLNGVYIGQADDPTATTKVAKRRMSGQVTPDMFGAVADGVTDDYDVLFATEKLAFEQGFTVEGTINKTYAFDGRWGLRVNFDGRGCRFTTTPPTDARATVSNRHNVSGTDADDVTLKNFSIDGQGKSVRGIYLDSGDNLSVIDVTIENCITAGIGCYNSENTLISRAKIKGITYKADGTGAADGIFFGGCADSSVTDCDIQDFRRIGIVSDLQGEFRSSNTYIANNRIWNANNCDDSTTEFNAAIWCEWTNGSTIENNTAWDLSGNPGQTSGRVRGIQVTAGGDNVGSIVNCFGNQVDGSTYNISGDNQITSVFMQGNHSTDKKETGSPCRIVVESGLHRLTIRDHQWDGVSVGGGSGDGLILMAFGEINDPCEVTLDNLSYKNLVVGTDTDWAHIGLITGNPKGLSVLNCRGDGFSIIDVGTSFLTDYIIVDNSFIQYGSSSGFGCLEASIIFITNSKISPVSGRSGGLFEIGSVPAVINCSNSVFDGVVTNIGGDVEAEFSFNNCSFINGCYLSSSGEVKNSVYISDCRVDEYGTSNGFIYTNYYNPTEPDRLFVRNTDFTHTSDVTPLQLRAYSPDVIVLNGNTTTATALHNFPSVTQNVNNVLSIAY
jgi:hypothetical protein